MIKRILLGLADKPSTVVATQRAINLARRHNAEIAGVTIVNTSAMDSVGPTPLGAAEQAKRLREHRREVTREHAEEAIARFEELCTEAGISHEVYREEGKPLERMIALSRYYDIVILNLHELFDYGVHVEPDEIVLKLVRSGVRPILACAPAHGNIRKILIAYNGTIEAGKAMRRLVHLQLWPDAEYKLACFEIPEDEAATHLEEATRYLKAHGISPEFEYDPAPPEKGLMPLARSWGADLIAIGASTRHRIMHRIRGDVPHALIKASDRHLFLAQ